MGNFKKDRIFGHKYFHQRYENLALFVFRIRDRMRFLFRAIGK